MDLAEYKTLAKYYDLFYQNKDYKEEVLVLKYAIGLGYTTEEAKKLILRSTAIFGGKLSFDEYQSLL